MKNIRCHFLVCTGAECVASGSLLFKEALQKALDKQGLSEECKVVETGCLGPCAFGPVAAVYPDGVFYQKLKPEDAAEIVQEHLLKGRPVSRLLRTEAGDGKAAPTIGEIGFFQKQQKIVMRNCGVIDPMSIEEYIARDGYAAMAKALTEMTPDQVIAEVKKSGLRGRGGAGFPTGLKWEFTRKAAGDVKYVLCNADEGDPGTFMDRNLIEGDPHSTIEGMVIAGYAIGASEGYAYVRAEYPLAIERLRNAIAQARERGLLGPNILGTKIGFNLEIRMGYGAFICGEETALMNSIEGNRGEPRPPPPFPANKGLWGKPSLINNVETLANIPPILLKGAAWYASIGTEKSKGTKVLALAGLVNNTGLVEVPMGTPLGDVIFGVGGGIPGGKKFKAAQIGGPCGGCIPAQHLSVPMSYETGTLPGVLAAVLSRQHLNVPVNYETLDSLGAIMGKGGIVVLGEDTCMVDLARFFLDFTQDESCGQCAPCRIGTRRMLEILTRICEGKGQEGDIEKLLDLGRKSKDASRCGLGQTAANPVLSTIRHFRDEYVAHIRDKRCPAGTCEALVRAPCQNACPAGVFVPGFVSLAGEKRYAEALRMHRERNPFASVCARVCYHACEDKCRRETLDEPVSIRGIKRYMVEQEVKVQLPEVRPNVQNAGRKVAIIGAGPAGLSCAYFLARLGYRPKVFEAESQPGGMLVQAIPAYRLPREEVSREVEMIEKLGVAIKTGMRLGKDFSLKGLRDEGYEAVFLGVGAPAGFKLGIPGEEAKGVGDAVRFLREHNIRGSAPVGKKVAVVGGDHAAVDAARTAVRLGASSVTLIFPRPRGEMPAYAEEVEEAEKEGVKLETLVAPIEVVVKSGKATGVKCQRLALAEFDPDGLRRPVAKDDSEFVVEADQVLAAIGRSLDAKEWMDGMALKLTRSEFIEADPVSSRTSVEWIFAGGDAVLGPSSVVHAVAQGEKAAVAMDKYLTGEEHAFWRAEEQVDTAFDPEADPVSYSRAQMRLIPAAKRKGNFAEVEQPFSEAMALREAKRCLRCDYRAKE